MDGIVTRARKQTFVLITGLPRSGTTLSTALVDGLADTVALSEPEELLCLRNQSRNAAHFCRRLDQWHASIAERLRRGESIADTRDKSGNPVTDYAPIGRGRKPNKPQGLVRFSGQPRRLILASKNNALYTSVLPELVGSKRFQIFAIVRDPMDLLQSWSTVPFPIARGTLPEGERFWDALLRIGLLSLSPLEKQMHIIELFFRRYSVLASRLTLLKYEAICANPAIFSDLLQRGTVTQPPIRAIRAFSKKTGFAQNVAALRRIAPTACRSYGYL